MKTIEIQKNELDENILSYRIINLEGAWLINENNSFSFNTKADRIYKNNDTGKVTIIKANNNKIYTATMPHSLETIRAFAKYPEEVIQINGDDATKLFVNFKFSKDYIDDSSSDTLVEKVNKKKLRKQIYTSKVLIDGVEYCYFKRGASKARTSNVIFCKKECYNNLYNPCLLGLKFIENELYDLTSKEAYTSLIMSSVIGTINIPQESILIINDLISPSFKAQQSVTKKDDEGNIYQVNDYFDVENNMSDGQLLMDESIFTGNDILSSATCSLLRNDFFKGNAVRVRLQDYYKENNITKVYDMYRGWIDADNILLVITPSACKYLKFADQYTSESDCFLDWLKLIPNTFGVVKIDHMGRYAYSNRLSYQMLNSMNLKKETVEKIMADELKYYKLLKDNTLYTSADIKKMNKTDKKLNRSVRNKMSYFLSMLDNKDNDNTVKSSDMISDLLKANPKFRFTKAFKDWKKEQLQDYMSNLRLGKVRIKNSIYAIMISCPYEFLVATTKEFNKVDNCIMDGWECYCPTYKHGVELLSIRNPQINAGNIACLTNTWHDEYKWFGYNINGNPEYDFVVFINSYNVDIMNRLQGCDWDIDSCYLCNQADLVSEAKESLKWVTPVNGIEGSKELKKYNNTSLAKLDAYLGSSTQIIGKIVNKSAIFNAYMYNAINNGYSQEYIDACYSASSTLSSFSQISIDMAKKTFKDLNLTKEMNNLNYTTYKNNHNQPEQILKFERDCNNTSKITISKYINSKLFKTDDGEDIYILADDANIEKIEYLQNLIETKDKLSESDIMQLEQKIDVYEQKMVVPQFFKYTAKDNTYRIPTKMDCPMDYLEEILDNVDTKAIQTDTINIKDLIVLQKELSGKAYNRIKIDKVRSIIDECKTIIDYNYYNAKDTDEEKKRKSSVRNWAKKEAIREIKELNLNEKTVYRILLRAFDLDNDYKSVVLTDYDEGIRLKEFNEVSMLVLTLLHKSYKESFLKCFVEDVAEKSTKKYRFWK